ncbi:hypothetical protein [Haloferax volcanii]|uniref:hypothetical protein n=1 Tax=Haloferax volcanii TaxID=2246 RepID=UPI00385C865A
MSSWNQYLSSKWKVMRKEEQWEEEAYLRRMARREGKEYKPPEVRKAEKKRRQKRAMQREFAEELREYENSPRQYIDKRREDGVMVQSLDGDDEPYPPGVWIPYVGSQGGHGWKNTRTGERKYQLEKPGTNSCPDEPLNIEGRWRDPGALTADNPDYEAPLSPGEARQFFNMRD